MGEREESTESGASKPVGSELERYYELMRERDLSELEIREGTFYLKLSRATGPVHSVVTAASAPISTPAPSAVAPAVHKTSHHSIASPLAGIFYRSPAPTSPSFVKEGDRVAFGDVLAIIEAMKVMNEIRSDRPGIIRKIVAENGKPVSAGQELFHLDPLP
jgi:acetyl-CoA carboxylase biotin carboxyl carrier protein